MACCMACMMAATHLILFAFFWPVPNSTRPNEMTQTGTRKDMEEALDFAARGKVTAQIETQPFAELNHVFERLRQGKVMGRIVLQVGEEQVFQE